MPCSPSFILGDCVDVMGTLGDNSYDVCVTSPPYNLGGDFHECRNGKRNSHGAYDTHGDAMPEEEYQAWQVTVLNELWRVVGSVCFYNHKVRIAGNRAISPTEWINKSPWVILQEITLDFGATANVDKRRCFPVTERIYVMGKTGEERLENNECYTDIWRMPSVPRSKSGHPATFHEQLAERCLRLVPSAKNVIDPFSGTGTVGVVAARLGIESLGIEISEKYRTKANQRIQQIQPALL
jgi:modification methylase